MKRLLIALSTVACAAVAVPAVADDDKKGERGHRGHRPDVIQLPQGFGPEGITTMRRHKFLVSSRENGAIYRGSLRTGEGSILVPGADDRAATGIKVDRRKRLFVSGADSGVIRIYDARSGTELRSYPVAGAGFINDVVLTRRAAYFTDSLVQVLYKIPIARNGELGELERIAITGDFVFGPGFNANGIEAVKGGNTLILVKSSAPGKLYTADARSGATKEIDLGGAAVTNGDGILLKGRKLYVVQNFDNKVAVVKLSRDLTEGSVVRELRSDDFDVPTTIARSGGRLYVVNAKFGENTPTQSYEVVKVPKR
ncbi:MAG: superoxide dismutase [Solirubrobacteraceae bacterium]